VVVVVVVNGQEILAMEWAAGARRKRGRQAVAEQSRAG